MQRATKQNCRPFFISSYELALFPSYFLMMDEDQLYLTIKTLLSNTSPLEATNFTVYWP